MNNPDIDRTLYNFLVSDAIKSARFKKLTIERTEDDHISVLLDGETFGLVGAITSALQSISNNCHVPVEVLLQMISTYNECLSLELVSKHEPDNKLDSLLDLFGKYVKDVKEGKEEGEK